MFVKDINPSDWIHIAEYDKGQLFTSDGKYILNRDRQVAFEAKCPHHGFPLHEAKPSAFDAANRTIQCPLHGLKISCDTGYLNTNLVTPKPCMKSIPISCTHNGIWSDRVLPPVLESLIDGTGVGKQIYQTYEYDFGWDKFMHVFEDNMHVNVYHRDFCELRFVSTDVWANSSHTQFISSAGIIHWVAVYPNLTFEIYPSHFEISRVEHIGANKCRHHLTTYLKQGVRISEIYPRLDIAKVYDEDRHIAERIRRPSFFHPVLEKGLENFYKWLDNYEG